MDGPVDAPETIGRLMPESESYRHYIQDPSRYKDLLRRAAGKYL